MADTTEPRTAAGRRLLVDIERVVWAPIPGSRDVWAADILAIEAEAREQGRNERNVGLVHEHGPLTWEHGEWTCDVCGEHPVEIRP